MSFAADNKVEYGLSDVHVAFMIDPDAEIPSYETPIAWPGAVSFVPAPQGSETKHYADNGVWWLSVANNGHTITLTMMHNPRGLSNRLVGQAMDDNGLMVEYADVTPPHFALMGQAKGSTTDIRFIYYDCVASRPTIEYATIGETTVPKTYTYTISVSPLRLMIEGESRLLVSAKRMAVDGLLEFQDFFRSVQLPSGTPKSPAALRTTGASWADTGYIGNQDSAYEIDFMMEEYQDTTVLNTGYIVARYSTTAGVSFYSHPTSGSQRFGPSIIPYKYDLYKRHRARLDRNGLTVDGVLTPHPSPPGNFTLGYTVLIGRGSNTGLTFAGVMRFYGIKIWSGTSLVRDLVPVERGNYDYSSIPAPENCFWCRETEQYYTSLESEYEYIEAGAVPLSGVVPMGGMVAPPAGITPLGAAVPMSGMISLAAAPEEVPTEEQSVMPEEETPAEDEA